MFRKAQRKRSKLRLAIIGPAGSGKTYSSLVIAMGLVGEGGKIALVDTENGSGELYSHLCEYDVAPLTPPFSPEKYIEAIKAAEKMGYDVLIIDSLSHAWAGQGGILDIQDKAAKAVKNFFAAWREVTPMHNRLVDAMLHANLHIIVTMRAKTAYEVQQDGQGCVKPVKIGLAPIQRDGLEYEFTVVLDLAIDGHVASVSKDRTGLLDGQFFTPTPDTGRVLRDWLESGASESQQPATPPKGSTHPTKQKRRRTEEWDVDPKIFGAKKISTCGAHPNQLAAIKEAAAKSGVDIKKRVQEITGYAQLSYLTREEADMLLKEIQGESTDPWSELEKALKAHDWHWRAADDQRAYREGQTAEQRLIALHARCAKIDKGRADELWRQYSPSTTGGDQGDDMIECHLDRMRLVSKSRHCMAGKCEEREREGWCPEVDPQPEGERESA